MTRRAGAMHVETSRSHQVLKDGTERVYQRHLLRRSYREAGKVRKETLANLSHLPDEAIEAVRMVLAGRTVIDADGGVEVTRSLPHGHVAAVHAMARRLGFPALLGLPCPQRDLACALVISRVARPASKLATIGWWDDVTLGQDLGVAGASTDEVYEAMDWLVARQDDVEAALAGRHLAQGGMALFDLSSSWVEGSHCELAAFGHSRDGKRGKPQIEYGLLTDSGGRPVAVRVFPGNTGDPTAFIEAVDMVRDRFGLTEAVMVGDRGMVTAGRLTDPAKIGVRAGKVINKRKVAKHFVMDIGERSFAWRRDQASIEAEAAFDGIYVIRTPVPAETLSAAAAVAAYKDLSAVEQDFKISKDDLDLRPIWHRLEDRVQAHVLICMLACYLSWHLRQAWAPLTFTDEHPPARDNPVAPARRSPPAEAKASRKATAAGQPVRGFRDLLDHLATLTRNTITVGGHQIEKITTPTPAPRQAFTLLGATIPITLQYTPANPRNHVHPL